MTENILELKKPLAGKVVIYPAIREMPSVYAKLDKQGEWTNEAEEESLRLMLP